jgi:hypothetical protein
MQLFSWALLQRVRSSLQRMGTSLHSPCGYTRRHYIVLSCTIVHHLPRQSHLLQVDAQSMCSPACATRLLQSFAASASG